MKTIKTILERLDLIKEAINAMNKNYVSLCNKLDVYSRELDDLEKADEYLNNSLKELTKIIESLINDKFTTEYFEAVLIKPYRGKPFLIKDGKRLDNEYMSGFDISWDLDRKIEVEVRNE